MPNQLWEDLKRRRVFRVAAAYIAIAFATLEGADLVLPRVGLPDRVLTVLVVLAVLGFPVALVLSWAFDITPATRAAGGTPTSDPPRDERSRRSRAFALVAATVVFAGAAWWWLPSVPDLLPPEVDESTIAVLPFRVRGGDEVTYLREGMPDLLATKLDGVGGIRVVDPHATFALLRDSRTEERSPDESRRVAARLGAARALEGSVVWVGGSLQIRTSIIGPDGTTGINSSVEGSAEDLFSLVDELVGTLVSGGLLIGVGDVSLVSLEGRTTTSNEALRLYLDGVSNFRRGENLPTTFEPLARATVIDSTFALAAYWAGYVAEYNESNDPIPFFRLAMRHQDRLGQRDRLKLSAALAGAEGRHVDAIRLHGALVERYPDDVAGWFQLAEQLAHTGHYSGVALSRARHAYERAVALDPGLGPAYYHLAHLGGVQRDTAALATWLAQAETTVDSSSSALLGLVLGMVTRDTAYARPHFELIRRTEGELDPVTLSGSMGELLGGTLDHASQASLAFLREYWLRTITDQGRAAAARRVARLESAAGRFSAAEAALREASGSLGTMLQQDLALVALHPAATDVARMDRAYGGLADLAPAAGVGEAAARTYLMARLAARMGRMRAFEDARATLAGTITDGTAEARFVSDLSSELDAIAARDAGDPAGALNHLLAASYWTTAGDWLGFPPISTPDAALDDRGAAFLRAELLREAGRDSAAVAWYEIASEGMWVRGPALHRLAEHALTTGEEDVARGFYTRLMELWSRADSELGPQMEDIHNRVSRLPRGG